MSDVKPKFFKTPHAFRAWLDTHHRTKRELLVGFYKVKSGKPSMTWPESVDEALSFGWIDGVRRRIDDDAYSIRFTPRKPRSTWSAINVKRVAVLTAEGRMHPAGAAAFALRDEARSASYSYERQTAGLGADALAQLEKNKKAWNFFHAQAPGYRRVAAHWVTSAKREETRTRRLKILIDCSGRGERIPPLTPSGTAKRVKA